MRGGTSGKARFLLVLGGLLAGLGLFELGFRLLEPRLGVDRERLVELREFVWSDGKVAKYEPRPHILYGRPRGEPGINALGFRDAEFPLEKRPGVLRIACLGSSTTEGGNPRRNLGSYPHFLRDELRKLSDRDVEVLNFGMSGWTTAEILVHYFLVVQDYSPDVVLIHEAVNDVAPRNWPGFRPDYSHYRQSWKEPHFSLPYRLLVRFSDAFAARSLRGIDGFGVERAVVRAPQGPYAFAEGRLPPETVAPFRRNVRSIAEHIRRHGGCPVLVTMPYDAARAASWQVLQVGIDEHNEILRELGQEPGNEVVDLAALSIADSTRLHGFFVDLVHMTPEGNQWKARRIAEALGPSLGAAH